MCMAKKTGFYLDTDAAAVIITDMMMPLVRQSTDAIGYRAAAMVASQSDDAPTFTISTRVGTIRNGRRAIGTITAPVNSPREGYLARLALAKSRDAGRV